MSQQELPLPPEHYARLRTWVIQQLRRGSEPPSMGMTPENRRWVQERVGQLLASARVSLPPEALERLVDEVGDEVVGYGPIGPLVRDPLITEIMVNGPHQVYVERDGKIVEVDVRFRDEHHVMEVIERILKPLGRKVDRTWPMADARLPDGSRVNVIIPPCALNGPTITIRKFPARRLTVEDLIRFGTMTPEMAEFLRACVIARLNIAISGGTGSGKTTLLNVLSAFIPEDERIITIEDAAELQLQQRHVVRLEAAPALPDGSGRITIRDLVINALRMRPDRILVGECRGAEALDMLQAMNTGHEGSMTTIHANSPLGCSLPSGDNGANGRHGSSPAGGSHADCLGDRSHRAAGAAAGRLAEDHPRYRDPGDGRGHGGVAGSVYFPGEGDQRGAGKGGRGPSADRDPPAFHVPPRGRRHPAVSTDFRCGNLPGRPSALNHSLSLQRKWRPLDGGLHNSTRSLQPGA